MQEIISIFEKYSKKLTGELGVGFKNLLTGEECYINKDVPFPAASTFKVPVLIELFRQAECEELSLDEIHELKAEDLSIGSGVLATLSPGVKMALRDYATLMMIVSDNTATDIVFNRLGKDNVRSMIEKMGLSNTRCDCGCDELVRRMCSLGADVTFAQAKSILDSGDYTIDEKVYDGTSLPNDITSPFDMVAMLSMIYSGQVVSRAACDQMLDIMEKCQTNMRIPYYLPQAGENRAKVAHKTGTLANLSNDCGIIRTKSQEYILALFYNGYGADESEKAANINGHLYDAFLADLSRDVFNCLHRE